jgi:hypothetical protein
MGRVGGALALVLVTAIVTQRVVSQEYGKKDGGKPEISKEQQEMMAKWQEMSTPGPHHKNLERFVGTWKVETKFWLNPGGEAQTGQMTAKTKWVLDGRYLLEECEGTSNGQPFKGMGFTGYDNFKKKYVSTWADNMSTAIMMQLGTCDSAAKSFTYTGDCDDCMTGKKKTVRSVCKVTSESRHTFEMFDTGPDGKEFRNLELVYTRM